MRRSAKEPWELFNNQWNDFSELLGDVDSYLNQIVYDGFTTNYEDRSYKDISGNWRYRLKIDLLPQTGHIRPR